MINPDNFYKMIIILSVLIISMQDLSQFNFFHETLLAFFIIFCYGHLYFYSKKIDIKQQLKSKINTILFNILYFFLLPLMSISLIIQFLTEFNGEYWITMTLLTSVGIIFIYFDSKFKKVHDEEYC